MDGTAETVQASWAAVWGANVTEADASNETAVRWEYFCDGGETLPLPCVSTAFAVKAPPLPWVSTAFAVVHVTRCCVVTVQ